MYVGRAVRQQQEELKERAIDLDNVGQKRKYFLHQCREKDAEIARLREAIAEVVLKWSHNPMATNDALRDLRQALKRDKP